MRMDPNVQAVTAADLVNAGSEKELAGLFSRFGQERAAKKIAGRIVSRRAAKKIETTDDLARIILTARKRAGRDRTHPATRVFQALRIAVNDELNALETALPQAVKLLDPTGRLVVISFHSLEDRIVKNFMEREDLKVLTKKPIMADQEEIRQNPRSRSGKLRAAEKLYI